MKGAGYNPIGIPNTFLKIMLPNLKWQLTSKYFNAFSSEDFVKVVICVIINQSGTIKLTKMHSFSTALKQESIKSLSTLINLGSLV